MAFDKNNTSTWMKVVIVVFAVILVVSMCLPFFSSCSFNSGNDAQESDDTEQESASTATTTVASVKAQYSGVISNLEQKLADNPDNTTAMASLGNNYMDMASAMRSASDYSDNADEVEAAYAKAAEYYEQYLAKESSQAVSVDHAICLFYGGKADEGVSELAEYVEGDGGDYAMAWFNLGIMHYTGDTPDYESAVEEFNKAAELDPDGSAGVSLNAQIYSQLAQNALDAQNSSDEDASSDGDASDASGEGAAASDAASSDEGAASDSDADGSASDSADAKDAGSSEATTDEADGSASDAAQSSSSTK